MASQMADCRGQRITVTIEGDGAEFTAVAEKPSSSPAICGPMWKAPMTRRPNLPIGKRFCPRWNKVNESNSPALAWNRKAIPRSRPGRFSEAALTRALEELGIGRPSTYASIIDTIQARDYVVQERRARWCQPGRHSRSRKLLENHLQALVDYGFTAQMEDDLDAISRGERASLDYLKQFYFGNGQPGLKKRLEKKTDEIDARDVNSILISEPEGEQPIYVRVGRYGPFLEQGDRRAAIPDELPPEEITLEKCKELFSNASQAEEPLGVCPDTGKPIYLKVGRFGPYVQRGTPDDEDKPQNASLMKGMTPDQVDLAMALKLLTLPRDLGKHPENGETITAFNGRFGPYIKCGEETRSLPAELSPLDVTFEQAIELLKQPKAARRGFGAKREPLKLFDASPVTGEKVQLLDGRYGMYVTDGTTNATVPKQTPAEEVTFEMALQLLKDRAAAGPSKKKPARKKKAARRTVASK